MGVYRQKRHSPLLQPTSGGGRARYSEHAPNVTSAFVELKTYDYTLCLWNISVLFSVNTNTPPMGNLGGMLHLLPTQLNSAVVGVAWEDERTLVVKGTGCCC